MKDRRFRTRIAAVGFTLIELLVAMAVLALVAVLLTGILTTTNRVAVLSNQSVDAAAQARLAFDRLAIDLAEIITAQNADIRVANSGGGDQLRFLAYVPSIGITAAASRGLSVISYAMAAHPDNNGRRCLLRGGKPIAWSDRNILGQTPTGVPRGFADSEFPAGLTPGSTDMQVLSPGVIQMAIAFQLRPDAGTVTLQDGTTVSADGGFVYSPPVMTVTSSTGSSTEHVDVSRIAGLLVGVVALDLRSLNLLDPGQVSALAAAFPVPANGVLPLARWVPIAENPDAMPTTIPLTARQGVRVFQRYFPLLDQEGVSL